jgi:hypothetical protein
LYLFLIVTSVTPATSATSLWVLLVPCKTLAIYIAAAATPVFPLPLVNPFLPASFYIDMAFDSPSPGNLSSEANLGT